MLLRSFITSARRCAPPPRPTTLKFFALSSFATSSSGPTPYQKLQMGAKEIVDAAISGKKVVVFSKSYCPYCRAAKQGIKELGVKDEDLVVFELDERDDGAAIQAYLATPDVSGQNTVPNIFISGIHVGGNDDFQRKRRNGELPKLNAQ